MEILMKEKIKKEWKLFNDDELNLSTLSSIVLKELGLLYSEKIWECNNSFWGGKGTCMCVSHPTAEYHHWVNPVIAEHITEFQEIPQVIGFVDELLAWKKILEIFKKINNKEWYYQVKNIAKEKIKWLIDTWGIENIASEIKRKIKEEYL